MIVNKHIELKRLTEVGKLDVIKLMNNSLVRQHMPLLVGDFNEDSYHTFIVAKEKLWKEYGYGPWAFIVDGQFAGWGGLQPEKGQADLALVLHPDYWGMGKILYKKIVNFAFNKLNISSFTVLFPLTRIRIKGLLQLGFKEDGELKIENTQFIRYRLENSINFKI